MRRTRGRYGRGQARASGGAGWSWICLLLTASAFLPLRTVRAQYNAYLDSGNTLETVATASDPINMATGEFYFLRPIVDLGGPLPLQFALYYGSVPVWPIFQKAYKDGLPITFRHNHRLTIDYGSRAGVDLGLGDSVTMMGPDPWDPSATERYGYQMMTGTNSDCCYFMDPRRDVVHIFRRDPVKPDYFLIRTVDRNGNALDYEYQTNAYVRGPDRVYDGLGRELKFDYALIAGDTNECLVSVRDQAGRTWSLSHVWNPADNANRMTLRSIVRPDGTSNIFQYAGSHFLAREVEPAGNWTFTNVWLSTGIRQTDPLGNTSTVTFLTALADGDARAALLNPDGTRRTFTHGNERRALKRIVDEERREARFDTEQPYTVEQDRFTNMVDRLGRSVRFNYDASGKTSARTDPAGRTVRYVYRDTAQVFAHPTTNDAATFTFRDLAAVEYPDGTRDGFARDARGRLAAFTNQLGAVTRYGYNSRGQVTAITNAAGGIVAFGYDTNGNLATHSDADSGTWSNVVDALGRVTRVVAPDGTSRQYAYDLLDRLTNVVDEAGVATVYRYDPNGNLTQAVHAAGTALARTNAYAYDALNRLVRRTDPAGFATTLGYTWWGAVSNVTGPDGASVSLRFTPSRFPLAVADPLGHETRVTTDAEGMPTGLTLPDGRTATSLLDALGRPVATVDPLSNATAIARDSYERVTDVVDRLGQETRIARDAEGRVTAVDVPGVGTARYAYDALGSVTNVLDPRSNAWSFGFSALGRMASIRDPLGRTQTFAYDAAGRLAGATYMDGSSVTNRRDARGAVTNRVYSDGTSLAFAFDALGRYTGSGGAAPVALDYDARDLVTNATFNGAAIGTTYDAAGRVASLAYGGGMTVTYAYDLRGLVTQVVDSVSGARVAFAYNANGERTRVERSNGVATEFDRDGAGRVTEIRHGAHGTLRMSYDAEDRIARIDQSLPLAAPSNLADSVETFAHDAANHLATAGYVQDARGRRLAEPGGAYRWDGADRLVSISNAAGVVTNVYTATGELARRIRGAVTTEFVHTWSLPLRPALVEKRNGVVQRYYVHDPGGRLLYHVEAAAGNAVRFHHDDHLGTTLFLTDGAGAVSDAYAYTAYGRLLRHTGTSEQPFTFLGTRGVRAEDGTSLYHMRARWYDARTARFVSFDPLWTALLSDPLQINPYQYVRGSPAMGTDVTGEGNRRWEDREWVSPWRTPDEWIKTVTPPPNPTDTAIAHWLRNRHAAPGEYAFLLPSTDEPRILGQTAAKLRETGAIAPEPPTPEQVARARSLESEGAWRDEQESRKSDQAAAFTIAWYGLMDADVAEVSSAVETLFGDLSEADADQLVMLRAALAGERQSNPKNPILDALEGVLAPHLSRIGAGK